MRDSFIRLGVGLLLVALLAMASPAQAALSAYMRVVGAVQGTIEGGATIVGQEGAFEITEIHHLSTAAAEGVDHQPLIILVELGRGIATLLDAMQNDENLAITLDFFRPSQTGEEINYYSLELQNARLVLAELIQFDNKVAENMALPTRMRLRFEFDAIAHIDKLFGESVEL